MKTMESGCIDMIWCRIQYFSSIYRVDATTRVRIIERQYSSMSKAQCAADRIGQNMIAKGILKPTRLDVHPHDGCQWIVERI